MSEHGMAEIAVSILRWIDNEPQPGIVEFSLVDANGVDWRFVDKYPIVSCDALDAHNNFPVWGLIRCEIISFETEVSGRVLAQIDTERPWGIEAIDETHVFKVEADRLDRNIPKPHETETTYTIETIVVTGTLK